MIYEKDTMPDGTTYERFEGTPKEILELMNCMPRELKEVDEEPMGTDYLEQLRREHRQG